MEKLSRYFFLAIIIPTVIFGGVFIFFVRQRIKLESMELQESKRQQEVKIAIDELRVKRDECSDLSLGVMRKWKNVVGVVYDENLWEECIVIFTNPKTGEIERSPLRLMKNE